jgi:DEAD/DEAH box helicase domain-containing protein
MWLTTSSGLEAQDYSVLPGSASTQPAESPTQAALNGAWEEVLRQTLKPLQAGLASLARAGAELPEVGLELANEKGKVVAEGELCWSAHKLAVLRDDQAEMADDWKAQGWTVLVLNEGMSDIEGQPWPQAVAQQLGLNWNEKE